MKRIIFLLLCYLSCIGIVAAETSEFKEVSGLVNGWRLEQYAGGGEPLVVRLVNTTPCDNNLSFDNTSQVVKNRFYAFMLTAKIASKPVTIYYIYKIDNMGNKTCNIVSFAADF